MPKIIEKLAYEYNELSDKAKQKLKDRYCEGCTDLLYFEVESLETVLEEMDFAMLKSHVVAFGRKAMARHSLVIIGNTKRVCLPTSNKTIQRGQAYT